MKMQKIEASFCTRKVGCIF